MAARRCDDGLFFAACGVSMEPCALGPETAVAWGVVLIADLDPDARRRVRGSPFVPTSQWGGLPLSFMLSFIGLAGAFPLGIARRAGRALETAGDPRRSAISFIELVRGVPLISVLFMATVMFPLFMPDGVTIDKLLRAQIAIILFAAAYRGRNRPRRPAGGPARASTRPPTRWACITGRCSA